MAVLMSSPERTAVLATLRVADVRSMASSLGATDDEIDEAEDEDAPGACLRSMVEEKLAALKELKMKDVKLKASALVSLSPEEISEAVKEADDRKEAVVQFVFEKLVAPFMPSEAVTPYRSARTGELSLAEALASIREECDLSEGESRAMDMAQTMAAAWKFLGRESPPRPPTKEDVAELCALCGIATGWGGQQTATKSTDVDWRAVLDPGSRLADREILIQGAVDSWDNGRWVLEEGILGTGSTGLVKCATDSKLGRVAIKLASETSAKDRKSLCREAFLMQRVRHEHICALHEHRSIEGGLFCLCMELLEGGTLEQRKNTTQEGRLAQNEALLMTQHILNALGHMHRQGVIHRDIKPKNIMKHADGRWKLIDLGIAAISLGFRHDVSGTLGTGTTGLAAMVGTPHWMSPEQFTEGLVVDTRTDLWSLGVVLYWALCGALPFAPAESDRNKIGYAITTSTATDLESALWEQELGAITDGLSDFVGRSMEKDRGKRYQSAEEMSSALENMLSTSGSNQFDVFISYRVWCQSSFADELFRTLSASRLVGEGHENLRMRVYLDKVRLLDGQRFDIGFISGLASSLVFTPLISRDCLKSFVDLGAEDREDFVLVEWIVALELMARGQMKSVFPIILGEQEENGQFSQHFFEELRNGCVDGKPLPDTVSTKSIAKAREFLIMLEEPIELIHEMTVKSVVDSMLTYQALLVHFENDKLAAKVGSLHGAEARDVANEHVIARCSERVSSLVADARRVAARLPHTGKSRLGEQRRAADEETQRIRATSCDHDVADHDDAGAGAASKLLSASALQLRGDVDTASQESTAMETLSDLARISSTTEVDLLSFTEEEIAELMKEKSIGVVARKAMLKEWKEQVAAKEQVATNDAFLNSQIAMMAANASASRISHDFLTGLSSPAIATGDASLVTPPAPSPVPAPTMTPQSGSQPNLFVDATSSPFALSRGTSDGTVAPKHSTTLLLQRGNSDPGALSDTTSLSSQLPWLKSGDGSFTDGLDMVVGGARMASSISSSRSSTSSSPDHSPQQRLFANASGGSSGAGGGTGRTRRQSVERVRRKGGKHDNLGAAYMRTNADDARTAGLYITGRLSVSSSMVTFACKQQGIEATINLADLLYASQPTQVQAASVLSSDLRKHGPIVAELVDVKELSSIQLVFAESKKKALRKKKQSDSMTIEFLLPNAGTASILFAHLESHRAGGGVAGSPRAMPRDGGKGAMSLSTSIDPAADSELSEVFTLAAAGRFS